MKRISFFLLAFSLLTSLTVSHSDIKSNDRRTRVLPSYDFQTASAAGLARSAKQVR